MEKLRLVLLDKITYEQVKLMAASICSMGSASSFYFRLCVRTRSGSSTKGDAFELLAICTLSNALREGVSPNSVVRVWINSGDCFRMALRLSKLTIET